MEKFKINEQTSDFGIKVSKYDFTGTTPAEIALKIVTSVASVCYQSESSIGSKRLFKMLEEESHHLPSSAFEFVPITLDYDSNFMKSKLAKSINKDIPCNIYKYGYKYFLHWVSNLRALHYDYKSGLITDNEYHEIMNTKTVLNMPVYKIENINMYTFGQLVRHRDCSFQVMSRRYTSDKKHPFQFNTEALRGLNLQNEVLHSCNTSINKYNTLIENGAKKEIARGIIPQFATTQLWFKFNSPQSLQNFLNIRLTNKAQEEIRGLAEIFQEK